MLRGGASTTVVLLATAAGERGGAAAAQPWEQTTVLGRLLDQYEWLGAADVHVITRAEWAATLEAPLRDRTIPIRLHVGDGPADDLKLVAAIAGAARGGVVLGYGDIVSQGEALAGLLVDPRIATGILMTLSRIAGPFGFRVSSRRGRVVSAASPYHGVRGPTGTFLGVLKVAPTDRERLVDVAERLSVLLEGPLPEGWNDQLDARTAAWRRLLAARVSATDGDEAAEVRTAAEAQEAAALPPALEAELELRRLAAAQDVVALALVGLVRDGVHVGQSRLRSLFWARPLSAPALERAAEQIHEHDEDEALLESAVKGSDGFFTTFFVSPYSKYIARWSAHRGFTPNQITLVSLAVGALAAAAFATGQRAGLVAGAILLQAAFTLDCVDGQLARYTRTFSKLGAWLDSIFDRTKEYLVFAGLAIGASRTGDPVWLLAGAALALQTMRHAIDFSYPISRHQAIGAAPQPPIESPFDGRRPPARELVPVDAEEEHEEEEEEEVAPVPASRGPRRGLKRRLAGLWRASDRSPRVRWVKKIIQFPIGERFAAISISAALFSPRVTFIVVLAWGGFAALYVLIGRTLRSLAA